MSYFINLFDMNNSDHLLVAGYSRYDTVLIYNSMVEK